MPASKLKHSHSEKIQILEIFLKGKEKKKIVIRLIKLGNLNNNDNNNNKVHAY